MDSAVRVSARAKGQRRKRTLSNTSPPPPQVSKRALKKTRRHPTGRRPARRLTQPPALQPPSPLFIRSSPPLSAQPDTVEEEGEEEEEEEKGEEEEEEEEEDKEEEEEEEKEEEDRTSLPPVPVSFMSRWKAVSGREALPGAVSLKYNTENLFYNSIKSWRDSIIRKCLPQIFNINRLKAAASYKRQLKANNFLYEVNDRNDLYKVLKLLKDLREQYLIKLLYLDLTLYLTKERPLEILILSPAPLSSQTVRFGRRTTTQI